jgi:RNB domain
MRAERPGDSVHEMRVRDCATRVARARLELAAALVARNRAFAAAHEKGLSWSALRSATGLSLSAVRRAVARGRGSDPACSPHESLWLAIDPGRTRIREDAFRVRTSADGRWLVEVGVPAVADLVVLDGVLDTQARERVGATGSGGTRFGMLPRSLENELSFGPGFCGPVLVVVLTLDRAAQEVVAVDVRRDTITPGEIVALSDDDGDQLLATRCTDNATYHSLAVAHCLVQQMTGADRRDIGTSAIVAEIMTAANVAATRWAADRGPILLRDKSGHFGSAEPAPGYHGQVTNPLRRYSSLVNQRMILAELDGRPRVYSPQALARLGRMLSQSSSAVTYSSTSPPTGVPLSDVTYTTTTASSTSDDLWCETLLVNTLSGCPSDETVASFRDRRARGLLTWQDFDLLLRAGDEWRDLREELVPWMRSQRPDILHEVLRNLAQSSDVSVEFEFTRPHDPIATAACACRVLLNGYATEWSVLDAEPWMDRPAKQARKGVRHKAAWSAIEALLGYGEYRDIAEDPVFLYPISDLGFDGPPSMFRNLAHRASQAGAPLPTFETVDVSPDDGSPLFRCTASALGCTAEGEGYRRGAAVEQAAHALLQEIRATETIPGLSLGA